MTYPLGCVSAPCLLPLICGFAFIQPGSDPSANPPAAVPAASATPATPRPVTPPAGTPVTTAAPTNTPAAPPAPGQTVRVGGDSAAAAIQKGDDWTSGTASITTPLPDGYPAPTPPNAIDLKTYPSIRRAEFASTVGSPDLGMNFGFFPLFNHIKRRDIAMTSPVEMDYAGLRAAPGTGAKPAEGAAPSVKPASESPASSGEVAKPSEEATKSAAPLWTMSFLYRSPNLGPTGEDQADARIKIVDTAPATYISIGMQGAYGITNVKAGLAKLEQWLAEHPTWTRAGEVRSLYYNGPDQPNSRKWLEVQLPVRLASPTSATATAPPASSAPTPPAPASQPAEPTRPADGSK